jgi:hypothetical protein
MPAGTQTISLHPATSNFAIFRIVAGSRLRRFKGGQQMSTLSRKIIAQSQPIAAAFRARLLLAALLGISCMSSAETHDVQITNGMIQATIHPPDPISGFYQGTRFDWSGVIGSLKYAGHNYYGPWFTKTDPAVVDYIYQGEDIVAGPCSAITGPVEEFSTNGEGLGFSEAKAGGTFLKIGVGVLSKPDDEKYSMFRLYDIVDHGEWSVQAKPDSVAFSQRVTDPSSGYGYLYEKIVRLVPGKPQMVIEHRLTNIGKRPIVSNVYDHNFLVLDNQGIGPDFTITLPFEIRPAKPVNAALGAVNGRTISYLKKLEGHDQLAMGIEGFGKTAADYQITIENKHLGAGMKITGDRPLESEELWSIRSILAMEPFIHISIEPGKDFAWKYTYDYYTIGK